MRKKIVALLACALAVVTVSGQGLLYITNDVANGIGFNMWVDGSGNELGTMYDYNGNQQLNLALGQPFIATNASVLTTYGGIELGSALGDWYVDFSPIWSNPADNYAVDLTEANQAPPGSLLALNDLGPASVPEPGTNSSFLLGVACLLQMGRRKLSPSIL